MTSRTLSAVTLLGAAALAASAAAALPNPVVPSPAYEANAPDVAETSTADAPRDEEPTYMVRLSFKKGGKLLSSPTARTIAGQPVTVQIQSQRPFVVGIGKDGEPIVQEIEEGVVTNLTVNECRDGIVTLDVAMAVSQITDVGRRGAVQTVKTSTQQVRIIEPVMIGGSLTSKAADGTEMTAKLEKIETN